MKTLKTAVVCSLLAVFSAASLVAGDMKEGAMMHDGVMMKDGKMMEMNQGEPVIFPPATIGRPAQSAPAFCVQAG